MHQQQDVCVEARGDHKHPAASSATAGVHGATVLGVGARVAVPLLGCCARPPKPVPVSGADIKSSQPQSSIHVAAGTG
jgi:hypothetical protein